MSFQLRDTLLHELEPEIGRTLAMLRAVPASRFSYQPDPKSMTLGRLAGHIAESPQFAEAMMAERLDFATIDWKPFDPKSVEELADVFARNSKRMQEVLADKDDTFLKGKWTMAAGDHVILCAPRVDTLRAFCIHHIIHHRGQLSVYLRLVGAPVPATYGPSADFPNF